MVLGYPCTMHKRAIEWTRNELLRAVKWELVLKLTLDSDFKVLETGLTNQGVSIRETSLIIAKMQKIGKNAHFIIPMHRILFKLIFLTGLHKILLNNVNHDSLTQYIFSKTFDWGFSFVFKSFVKSSCWTSNARDVDF